MSTSSLPSAWSDPIHFSVCLPTDFSSIDSEPPLLACSAAHVILAYNNRVLVYSLPEFDLIEIFEPGRLATEPLRIFGEILVIRCRPGSARLNQQYIWDLKARKHIGTIEEDGMVSIPETELVNVEQSGQLIMQEWPEHPVLLMVEPFARDLKIYSLPRPVTRESGYDPSKDVHQVDLLHPSKMITMSPFPTYWARCLASKGRTALAGGQDGAIRVWDIITGKCQLVLIGHTSNLSKIKLDQIKIYSSSSDRTVRVWNRYSGDCLHVLNVSVQSISAPSIHILPSHLITSTQISQHNYTITIWDIVSGNPIGQVDNQRGCALGPIQGEKQTLITREVVGSIGDWVRIWDIKTGGLLARISIGPPHTDDLPWIFREKYLVFFVKENGRYLLRGWDLSSADFLDGGSKANECMNPEYSILDELD